MPSDVPSFAPNGDGYRETVSFSGTANEPGSLVAKAIDADDDLVDSFSTALSGGAGTLTWDGRTSDGFAADGRYTISVRAKDLAGNLSAAQTRTVDLYAALGFVDVVAHRVLPAGRRRHGEDDDVLDAPPVAGDGDLDGGRQEQRLSCARSSPTSRWAPARTPGRGTAAPTAARSCRGARTARGSA